MDLEAIAQKLRVLILSSTTEAGSGHPTSSLSSVELITALVFGGFFEVNFQLPKSLTNDRLIFSKGHAAPLLYSLYSILGLIEEKELFKLRKIDSWLQGHPLPDDFLVDVATGSLGQGLSVGLGMALGLKLYQKLNHPLKRLAKVWVLLGDSELSEGQIWEAVQVASYYQVENLIAIVDVNRLGQRGQTMVGWNLEEYKKRFEAFGWKVFLVQNGHDFSEITSVYREITQLKIQNPKIILAKTIKGKGVSFLEDKENWHGKALTKDQLEIALGELKEKKDISISFIEKPKFEQKKNTQFHFAKKIEIASFNPGEMVSTRAAYGEIIKRLGQAYKQIVVLDAETSNSTYSERFKEVDSSRFFEMFIAEQNMISCALGFEKVGFLPFASTFSAFLTRAFDQLRMASYSKANLRIIGSHSGISIGEDGPSQMGLEDIAMFRTLRNSVIFYPADAISCQKLVLESLNLNQIVYLRTTRNPTPVIYTNEAEFTLGGFKIIKSSDYDQVAIISAGITLFEALKAEKILKEDYGVSCRIIDLYCIKPIDREKLLEAIGSVKWVVTVEDHYFEGGLGSAVTEALSNWQGLVFCLAVAKIPRSGKSEELFHLMSIDYLAIVNKIKEIVLEKKKNETMPNKGSMEVLISKLAKLSED